MLGSLKILKNTFNKRVDYKTKETMNKMGNNWDRLNLISLNITSVSVGGVNALCSIWARLSTELMKNGRAIVGCNWSLDALSNDLILAFEDGESGKTWLS